MSRRGGSMAVWSASGCKDTGLAVHLTIVVTMLLVSPCLTAQKPSPWWTNACNSTPAYSVCTGSNSSPSFRHGRSTNEVKIQLDIFINSLRFNTRRINRFYTEITHDRARPNTNIKNLNLERIIKQMRAKKKERKGNELLKFYVGLQKVARMLDQTVGVKIDSPAVYYDTKPRQCYLTEILWSLKSLLCEVYEAILQEVKNADRRLEKHTIRRRGRRIRTMDMTGVFISDISLLKKMEWFVKKSQKILSSSKPVRTYKS